MVLLPLPPLKPQIVTTLRDSIFITLQCEPLLRASPTRKADSAVASTVSSKLPRWQDYKVCPGYFGRRPKRRAALALGRFVPESSVHAKARRLGMATPPRGRVAPCACLAARLSARPPRRYRQAGGAGNGPMSAFRVFLSTVSSEFGAARDALAKDLSARGATVSWQEAFRQEPGSPTLLGLLHDYGPGEEPAG